MTAARDDIIRSVWRGLEPFTGPAEAGHVDVQGWASDNPYLSQAIRDVRPRVVVEIGVWKGGSTMTMAREIKALGLDAVVIAIDTWLGSWDHWIQDEWFGHLKPDRGYPTLYRTFAANIVEAGLSDFVVPLPLDSVNAVNVLKARGVRPDVVHIDGGHDFEAVTGDLAQWWPMLRSGGVLIGDDYHASGDTWPDVRRAFHTFFNTDWIENQGGKCILRKGRGLERASTRIFV